MFISNSRIKKIIALAAVTLAPGMLYTQSANAGDQCQNAMAPFTLFGGGGSKTEQLLTLVAWFTCYTDTYTYNAAVALNNWIIPDTSDTTSALQSTLASYTNTATNSMAQNTPDKTGIQLQQQLTNDFFGSSLGDVTQANDITFLTMLGSPIYPSDPRGDGAGDIAYNFIKNASGINMTHTAPSDQWRGSKDNKDKYTSFYNTISSIQSYNAYVLGQMYADYKNGMTNQTSALMQQAGNSNWFSQVASENIGYVLRQILMYNSESFVLLAQLLQTQRQMAEAQAMTNTLIVIGNQFTENQLIAKARGG
ncbi:MAG: hypothetical protein ABI370_04295 [Gammaproteobacteria bacterium]